MPPLLLVADEVKDPWHWFWRLKDDRGTLLAHHEVALDPAEWRAQAFTDLYRYVRQHADPGRWSHSTTELLGQVGAWAGEHVLGKVGPAIVKQGTPITVRVELPADQKVAEGLQYLPLELAHVGGQPLARAGREPRRRGPPGRGQAAGQGPHGQAAADAGRLQPAHRRGSPEPAARAVLAQGDDPARSPAPRDGRLTCACSSMA